MRAKASRQLCADAALDFGLVFGAGFALGVSRTLLLEPALGARTAELIELPLMILVLVFAARFVVVRRSRQRLAAGLRFCPQRYWALVGLVALALLLAAEVALGLTLRDLTLRELVLERDPVAGGAYLASLAFYAVLPALLAKRIAPAGP